MHCCAMKCYFTVYREIITYKSYAFVVVLCNLAHFYFTQKNTAERKIRKGIFYKCILYLLHPLALLFGDLVFKTKNGKCYYSLNKYVAYYFAMLSDVIKEIKFDT